MTVAEIRKVLDAEILTGEEQTGLDLTSAFASDLMSDVLAYGNGSDFLITGLANAQAIRTAEMLDISVVLFVRGKALPESLVDLAKEREITILKSPNLMFTVCGKLYDAGLRGVRT